MASGIKKLSLCTRCGEQLVDDDDIYIEGIGKYTHAGPLVGRSLQEPVAFTHLRCI